MTTRYGTATVFLMGLAAFIFAAPRPLWPQQDQQTVAQRKAYLEAVRSGPVPYKNMREALAAMKSTDTAEVQRAYDYLPRVPVTNRDDLMALYEEAKGREDSVPLMAADNTYNDYVGKADQLAERLKSSTDPALQDDVATLLKKEDENLQRESLLPVPEITMGLRMKGVMRYQRLAALITAAGDGKNESARPALWKIVDQVHDGYPVQMAAEALGKMKHPEDLDKFIEIIKQHPKYRISLSSFGTMVIPRVMKEIDNPNVTQTAKMALVPALVQASSHDNIQLYVPLLNHDNTVVANAASDAIEKNLRSEDADLIRKLILNPSRNIRASIIIAIGEQAWSDDYAPLMINVLRNDPDYFLRSAAANYLAKHKVQSAVPALQQALHDSSHMVRDEAASALGRLGVGVNR